MNLVKLKFTVVRVSPNGEVPKRYHREVWGYAVPLEGEGVIEVTTESGHVEKHLMNMQSLMAMPPNVVHRVRNMSSKSPFVFLIVQSPKITCDFTRKLCVQMEP